MTHDEAVRFIVAANRALAKAGVDNRIRPLLELAPPDFADFIRALNPAWANYDRAHPLDLEYMGCVVRVKR